jgi:predicted glutamine amidotransferase
MCGIAGFSLAPNSNINVRELSHELLVCIEQRGYMASGFAYQIGDTIGWHKDAVTGSALSLKTLPKNAQSVILHTRLATHGSTSDNDNNHPVMSPKQEIALVHNGVIYNHRSVRKQIDAELPEVDTSVIPALIESKGVDALNNLDGDAAIAWFNKRQSNMLHIARYQHSPLVVCQVEDGSFIFCSTEDLLWKALIKLDLMPEWMYSAKELDYFQVSNGVLTTMAALPEPKFVDDTYDYNYFRHQTAGAKGKYSSGTAGASSVWESPYFTEDDDYRPSYKTADILDEEDADFYTTNENTKNYKAPGSYWVRWTDLYDDLVQVTRYLPTQRKVWEDDIWLFVDDEARGEIRLHDYGYLNQAGDEVSVSNYNSVEWEWM